VRLSASNFTFSQAAGSGADLRFTKSDGISPLPFEIESWDSSAAAAVVWVKADTVYGNDDSHFVLMHWGAPGAVPLSGPAAVFDTAAGFRAVWHLNGSGSAACLDATANRLDGTPSDTAPSRINNSVIGTGQGFNGMSSYFTINNSASGPLNFPDSGFYSISAWAYVMYLDNDYHVIVGKHDQQYGLQLMAINMWEFIEYAPTSHFESVRAEPQERAWTLVTAVRAGPREYLYINGFRADTGVIIVPDTMITRDTTHDVMIGRHSPAGSPVTRYFNGVIDEVRMSSVAYSADWIRLCYMNQKQGDALVVFRD
jgi:biopolymer transport protein ExbB